MQIDLAELGISALKAEPSERAVPQWDLCRDAGGSLDTHLPRRFPEVPTSLRSYFHSLEDLVRDLGDGTSNLARDFGSWRATVTSVEAQNARTLQLLGSVVQRLRELVDAVGDNAVELLNHVELFLTAEWHVQVPLDCKPRLWSQRVARRYDLLPGEWREL